jgi:ABC-type transport system substrate-binding protein
MKHVISVLLALSIAACGPGTPPAPSPGVQTSTPADPPTVEPTLTRTPSPDPIIADINLGRPPVTIDPTRALTLDDATANDVIEATFVGLTRLDPATGEVSPWLAREWETSRDGLQWTFYLRDDVHWVRMNADTGEIEQVRPVTSSDVVAAVARACAAPSDLPGLQAVLFVAGCEAINERVDEDITPEFVEQELGARVLNDTVMEITLTQRVGFLPNLLAMPVFRPIPPELIEEAGGEWTQPARIMTSGPYAIQPNIPAQEGYTLVANPHWPFPREGNIDVVQIGFDDAGFTAWQNGEVQLSTVPEGVVTTLDTSRDDIMVVAQPAVALVGMNYDTFPFEKVGVRQAFALALDREQLITDVLQARGQAGLVAGSVVPPGTADSSPVAPPTANIELAREKLAQAGHPGCILIPNTTLLVDQTEFSRLLGEAMVAQWQAALECPDSLLRVEQATPSELLIAHREPVVRQFQPDRAALVLLYWQGDYLDPYHYFADILGCKEQFPDAYLNAARPCVQADEDIADLLEAGDRSAAVGEITTALFGPDGETPATPLYTFSRVLAVSGRLTLPTELSGPLQFDRWVLAEQ